jgi:hypothetical protein
LSFGCDQKRKDELFRGYMEFLGVIFPIDY